MRFISRSSLITLAVAGILACPWQSVRAMERVDVTNETSGPEGRDGSRILWINHLAFLAGDPTLTAVFDARFSLGGLSVTSTTLGDTSPDVGNKEIITGVQVPPGQHIRGVRVCYNYSNPRSFISQVRLSQTQNPPSSAVVMLDDGTDQTEPGPRCFNSELTDIDTADGSVSLSLRLHYADVSDAIRILAVGLWVD